MKDKKNTFTSNLKAIFVGIANLISNL